MVVCQVFEKDFVRNREEAGREEALFIGTSLSNLTG